MPENANKTARQTRKSYFWILLACLVLLAVSKTDWSTPIHIAPLSDAELVTMRPLVEPHSGFAGSDSCLECHEDQHRSWHASWHHTMTQEATLENILGDFNVTNLTFADTDGAITLFKRDGRAWFRPDYSLDHRNATTKSREEYPIVMMTGSHNQQMYWYPIGDDSTLAVIPLVYLIKDKRWIPRKAKFLKPSSREYDSETGRWNKVCLQCHSTGPWAKKHDKDVLDFGFDTQVSELGISCENCHGRGQNHVTIYRNPESSEAKTLTDHIVHPAKLDHRISSQICAACHSVRSVKAESRERPHHEPGLAITNHYNMVQAPREWMIPLMEANPEKYPRPEDLDPSYDSHFWWDGMIRTSSREYDGLIQSACHTKGEMSCISCHALHQPPTDKRPIKEWANDQLHPDSFGDQACLNCHDSKTYSAAAHTHHLPNSTGSLCYNCHMPHTSYGLLKAIRSHTITSPTVIETLEVGRPNACNLCHLDKTLEWTGTHLADWYGHEKPSFEDSQKAVSSAVLMALEGDAGQRAIIVCAMSWTPAVQASHGTNWIPPILSRLLHDPYEAIRYAAGHSLSTYPGFTSLNYDFLAAKPALTNAAISTHRIWAESKREGSARPEVLLKQGGSLDETRFEEIYARRNDREVRLKN